MKFGPQRRIRKHLEFQEIQRRGQRVVTTHFIWVLARSKELNAPARLGITASKRVGNAVRRNRLKRLVRAAFRELEGMLPAGFELVVICRRDEPDISTQTVVQQWRGAQKRVKRVLSELTP